MYKLLIVDDEWVCRHTIKKHLNDLGHKFKEITEAENGKEALELLLNNPFDAVITDIRMPVIDGLSLLKEIHSKDSSIPVILVSTHSDFEYAKQGIQYNAFEYLVKPIEKQSFSILLEKLIGFLENKENNKIHQSKMEKVLSEKLDFEIKEEYEEILYALLLNNSKELDSYLEELIVKYFSVYGYDYFKLGVVCETLIKKIEERLLETFGFARKLYTNRTFSNEYFSLQQNNSLVIAKLKNEFSRISSFIRLLHLDQTDSIIKKLCEYAAKESEKKPTLDEAAVLLNYNSDYLGKLFKLKTGESFTQFSAKLKLEHAKKLLQNRVYRNYEISEMLGYKDVGYFCKLFKEYTGMTPSEYKKGFTLEG